MRLSVPRAGLATIALLFLAIPPQRPAHAQSRVSPDFEVGYNMEVDYSYYEVRGTTAEEIHRSLNEHGPRTDGRLFFALTGVETSFRFRHVEDGPMCRFDDVGLRAQVMMRLPKWTGRADADESVQDAWDSFLERLMRHEAQHVRIIESGTRKMYNALLDLRAHSCSVLGTQANLKVQEMSQRQARENAQLDDRTGHGALEGAVWPPLRQAP